MSSLLPSHPRSRLGSVLCMLLWVGPSAVLAQDPAQDAHSLCLPSGPPPGAGYEPYELAVRLRDQKVIAGVPAYLWRHGCGPTAAGMVIGYWDGQGFPLLIPGDASTQTEAVNQALTSTAHYDDYSLPIDSPPTLLADRSELGGAHTPHNCLGDFMKTSWSSRPNYYGWSWLSDVDDALLGYTNTFVNATYGAQYTADSWNEAWGTFTWDKFRAEIDNNRPMVFLVDSDGDGSTDHFVPAIGYRDSNGYPEYACFDTWGTAVRWERFREVSSSYSWGMFGATYYRVSYPVSPGVEIRLWLTTEAPNTPPGGNIVFRTGYGPFTPYATGSNWAGSYDIHRNYVGTVSPGNVATPKFTPPAIPDVVEPTVAPGTPVYLWGAFCGPGDLAPIKPLLGWETPDVRVMGMHLTIVTNGTLVLTPHWYQYEIWSTSTTRSGIRWADESDMSGGIAPDWVTLVGIGAGSPPTTGWYAGAVTERMQTWALDSGWGGGDGYGAGAILFGAFAASGIGDAFVGLGHNGIATTDETGAMFFPGTEQTGIATGQLPVGSPIRIGATPEATWVPEPGTPSNPSPVNGASVSISTDLDWGDAQYATSYDVYFGTVNPPPLAGNTTSSSWPLPTLAINTTYHWQVIARNATGIAAGPVWSFTTYRRADLNCDGRVDFDDINPFVAALASHDGYVSAYPNCRYENADCDANGYVDFGDINPFVECLVLGGCP